MAKFSYRTFLVYPDSALGNNFLRKTEIFSNFAVRFSKEYPAHLSIRKNCADALIRLLVQPLFVLVLFNIHFYKTHKYYIYYYIAALYHCAS